MKIILLYFSAVLTLGTMFACSSNDEFFDENDFENELVGVNAESNSQMIGMDHVSGGFSIQSYDKYKSYGLIIHSLDELKEQAISVDAIYNPFFSREIYHLEDYYKDIDWNRQSLVILKYPCWTIDYNIKRCEGNVYKKDNKFYAIIDCDIDEWPSSQMTTTYGVAFVVNAPNLKKEDLKVKVNAMMKKNEDGKGVDYNVSKVIDINYVTK